MCKSKNKNLKIALQKYKATSTFFKLDQRLKRIKKNLISHPPSQRTASQKKEPRTNSQKSKNLKEPTTSCTVNILETGRSSLDFSPVSHYPPCILPIIFNIIVSREGGSWNDLF